MLFDLIDTLQRKRRLLFVAVFLIIDFWLLSFGAQLLQTHRSDITSRIHISENAPAPAVYQSDMLTIDNISAGLDHAMSVIEVSTLRTAIHAADGMAKAERQVQAASESAWRTGGAAATASGRAATQSLSFAGRIVTFPSVAVRHGSGQAFETVSELTNSRLTAVIQPEQNLAVPVITAEQAHQAYLIQNGTLEVKPIKPTGAGGACDNGAGNGGYPMEWCDAPMDNIHTVAYSNDRINRECTSYAYWYFTTVGGHSDFHVTGNANRWTATSNYPVHKAPAVGAIAVETAGAYGHVAIVQALPGQTYDGKAVPDGYILVSEMNYDWHGHFRYSYSPLGKFDGYIYP